MHKSYNHSVCPPKLGSESILVVGTARNCGKYITRDVSHLLTALKPFTNLRWLVIESDSDDDTTERLKDLESKISGFKFISLGRLREELPLRTQRLAYCRNNYIEELKHNRIYEDVKYVIVTDLDGINNSLTESAILSCWVRDDWAACTANQRGPYYDVWALRHYAWSPNDWLKQRQFLLQHNVKVEKAQVFAKYSRQITIPEDADWINVDSAFGGFAIYRKEAIVNGQYRGINSLGEEISEHVTLHKELISKGYRIFINPKLINSTYNYHTNELRLYNRVRRMGKNGLKYLMKRITGDSLADIKKVDCGRPLRERIKL